MKQKQTTRRAVRSKKETHYPAHYLAIVLAAVLLVEGFMLGAASASAWQEGIQVLDMSGAVGSVFSDLGVLVTPMMDQVAYVNDFYQAAATQLMVMLDFSDHDLAVIPRMVVQGYDMASVEVAKLIDFSSNAEYWPQVAGASLER